MDIISQDGLQQEKAVAPMILPHELFGALHDRGGKAWRVNVCGDGQCDEFWRRMSGVCYMQGHPVLQDPGRWQDTIPLGFHGDGAAFTKLDKLMAFSWNGILGPGGGQRLDSRYMICAVPMTWLLTGQVDGATFPTTLYQLTVPIAWSFACLMSGTYPRTDHLLREWPRGSRRAMLAGSQIAGQWRAVLLDFRGDWEFQSMFWNVPSATSLLMCWSCWAGLPDYPNFSDNAPWRARPRTTQEYRQAHPPGRVNAFATLPGWRVEFIKWDETHLCKLGVARLVAASSLLRLVQRGLFGRPPLNAQLARAWAAFREWAWLNKVQHGVRRFTRARFSFAAGEWPEASTKAWNTRVVIAWLTHAACTAPDAANSDDTRMLALLLRSLNEAFLTMESCRGVFFTPVQAATFTEALQRFMAAHTWLSTEALRTNELLWPIRPKHHGLCHVREFVLKDSRNPKRYGTIMDEDFLGRIVQVANKCHRRSIASGVLLRYLLRLHRHWRCSDRSPRLRIRLRPRARAMRRLPPRL